MPELRDDPTRGASRDRTGVLRALTMGRFYRRVLTGELSRAEPELRLLPHLLTSGELFVDVGANIGQYSFVASQLGCRVEAFEPHPKLAARLRATLRKAAVHETALSDGAGVASLTVPLHGRQEANTRGSLVKGSGTRDARSIDVSVATLDSFTLDEVALIKIDVEGHEVSTLAGAMQTINRWHPSIIIEVEEDRAPGALTAVKDLLQPTGYRGFFLDRNCLITPYEQFAVETHQPAGRVSTYGKWSPSEYVNNFIWIHPSRIADGRPADPVSLPDLVRLAA